MRQATYGLSRWGCRATEGEVLINCRRDVSCRIRREDVPERSPGHRPLPDALGHEFAGTVAAVGPRSKASSSATRSFVRTRHHAAIVQCQRGDMSFAKTCSTCLAALPTACWCPSSRALNLHPTYQPA